MGKYEEVLVKGRGPRVLRSKSTKVQDFPRSRGPKDQDISNAHTNTSLTLKKVHLVRLIFNGLCSPLYPVKYEKHEGLPWLTFHTDCQFIET